MSHHVDRSTAVADGRLTLCDLYAFRGGTGTSVLVMTVNPDAGRSSTPTFATDAVYEFAVDTLGGAGQDLAFRFRFEEPGDGGRQSLRASYTGGTDLSGLGHCVATGLTGADEPAGFARLPDGRVWAGAAADPFHANGPALSGFLQAVRAGRYAPEAFGRRANTFEGRNVNAIVLEIPDELLGSGRCSVWATITLHRQGAARRVSRIGQPMLRPLFFNRPGECFQALNAGVPRDDRLQYGERVTADALRITALAGDPAPTARARRIADAFLPDVLRYMPGQPVRFHPGDGNGRALTDDAFATALSFVTGGSISASRPSYQPERVDFPYLSPPRTGDLQPLEELFGLRPPRLDPTRAA